MLRIAIELRSGAFALDARVQIAAQGVTGLFGASGCGKTTLLRCIAGLEPRAAGLIECNGLTWLNTAGGIRVPAHARGVGFVFQEASLFEHLDVQANLRFGLDRTPVPQRKLDWTQVVRLLELEPLLERMPARLSGGERQRVAIGRALLASPSLLLMDEPLAALDAPRKRELLATLSRIRASCAIPLVLVSHQLEDLVYLADRLVAMDGGRVVAHGTVNDVLLNLGTAGVLDDELGVVIDAKVASRDERFSLSLLEFPGGALHLTDAAPQVGQQVRVRLRARDVSLARSEQCDSSILNRFPARVLDVSPAANPAQAGVRLDANGVPVLALITRRSVEQLAIRPGETLWVQVKAVALVDR
jgi:molybdate transport system ATP-binding protein